MSAVISLSDYAARVMRRPESDEQFVMRIVRQQLEPLGVHPRKIAQAQARAARALCCESVSIHRAIERVVKWALGTDDPEPSPLAA